MQRRKRRMRNHEAKLSTDASSMVRAQGKASVGIVNTAQDASNTSLEIFPITGNNSPSA